MAILIVVLLWEIFRMVKPKNTKKRNQIHSKDFKYTNPTLDDLMVINPLPENVDWEEINSFLKETHYGSRMTSGDWFMLDWQIQPCVIKSDLAETSLKTLQFLSADMAMMYSQVIMLDRKGEEDIYMLYDMVKAFLEKKYSALPCGLSERIFEQIRFIDQFQNKNT